MSIAPGRWGQTDERSPQVDYQPSAAPALGGRQRRRPGIWIAAGLILVVVLAGAGLDQYQQRLPAVPVSTSLAALPQVNAQALALPWPATGAGAVAISGVGVVATNGPADPTPAYSVAKVMLAIMVLQDKPLAVGGQGPTITIDAADVADYQARLANQESVVPVQAGETLTEYQALEALLIPSANNIAAVLAKWDGGVDQMIIKLNLAAGSIGLAHTTIADVAGVAAGTVSTPTDMVMMGDLAMANPVMAGIVSQTQVTLPVAGVVTNVDKALGLDGIIGIKTGSGAAGAANFLFAARQAIEGRQVTILGALVGQPSLTAAFASARALVVAAGQSVRVVHAISAGQVVGSYRTPWGSRTQVVAVQALDLLAWPGLGITATVAAQPLVGAEPQGSRVGSVTATSGRSSISADLVTQSAILPPGPRWLLLRDREG